MFPLHEMTRHLHIHSAAVSLKCALDSPNRVSVVLDIDWRNAADPDLPDCPLTESRAGAVPSRNCMRTLLACFLPAAYA